MTTFKGKTDFDLSIKKTLNQVKSQKKKINYSCNTSVSVTNTID